MGFMACSRRLDQTGMYLKNEYSVFKGHPDFRPYKVSLTRILRFRVGLVGALWLSLQDYIRFVLIFSVSYAVGLGQKKYLVGFPTRHRRRFYLIRLHIMHPKICFTKFAWFFSRTLKLIICSFCMNNQHFNFWSSNDIYHVNFLLICFTQSKFLSARIQNPYHRNLLIESFP